MTPEEFYLVVAALVGASVATPIAAFMVYWKQNKRLTEYKSLRIAIKEANDQFEQTRSATDDVRREKEQLEQDTASLRVLKSREDSILNDIDEQSNTLNQLTEKLDASNSSLEVTQEQLHDLQSKLDLYSRIDEFTEFGHFDVPDYLYETSQRFAEEIKVVRAKQKELIKAKAAVTPPDPESLDAIGNKSEQKRILQGQVKLLLSAFNVECDLLIGKVSPSNYTRTLERIEKLANTLERSAATLHCGFHLDYVELKFKECTLQYQFKLRKQEEQEEQRQIREQMREEQKARREYERAIRQAEEEEELCKHLLEKARTELDLVSTEKREEAERKIQDLELRLRLAEEKEQRAKSLAEQTRRGHVYIISNIGSFGDNVYKIGLTRRLDPMERVKELGDASVPFPFDVHALILVDDAPALESEMHKRFSHRRLNAVNLRKEFFKVSIEEIEAAAKDIAGSEIELRETILAQEYFESRRLIEREPLPESEAPARA